jgi:hypothetical protein
MRGYVLGSSSKRQRLQSLVATMSSITVEPCSIPLETGVMHTPPQISGMGSSKRKLTLVVPTLHEVESLSILLDRIFAIQRGSGFAIRRDARKRQSGLSVPPPLNLE